LVSAAMPTRLVNELRRLAEESDRSFSAELRRAARAHVRHER